MAPFPHKLAPMMRRLVTSLAMVCALSVAAPAIAAAQSGGTAAQAITDCNDHGTLTAHYSADALRTALATMPADVREYTDCYDVIEKQLFAQLGTSAAGSTTTGSSSGGSVLPTWLIIVIVLLALAALTFGALAIRNRRAEQATGGPEDDQGGPDDPGAAGGGGGSSDPGASGGSGPAGPGSGGGSEPGDPGSPD